MIDFVVQLFEIMHKMIFFCVGLSAWMDKNLVMMLCVAIPWSESDSHQIDLFHSRIPTDWPTHKVFVILHIASQKAFCFPSCFFETEIPHPRGRISISLMLAWLLCTYVIVCMAYCYHWTQSLTRQSTGYPAVVAQFYPMPEHVSFSLLHGAAWLPSSESPPPNQALAFHSHLKDYSCPPSPFSNHLSISSIYSLMPKRKFRTVCKRVISRIVIIKKLKGNFRTVRVFRKMTDSGGTKNRRQQLTGRLSVDRCAILELIVQVGCNIRSFCMYFVVESIYICLRRNRRRAFGKDDCSQACSLV